MSARPNTEPREAGPDSPGPTVGAVCVLYGTASVPDILLDLAERGVTVVVVDNSDDLAPDQSLPDGLHLVRPGRNLGYSRGINTGVRALLATLEQTPDALLVVNPDIVGDAEALLDFAHRVADTEQPVLAAPTGGDGHFGFIPSAPPWLVVTQYLLRTSWHPRSRSERGRFLSGALLGLNRAALDALAPEGELLDSDLFFMDDVELSDRARAVGALVTEIPSDGELAHVGGTSMRRRPAVRIYFSRVSKVRYWQARSRPIGGLLRGFFWVETGVGRLAAGRATPDGSQAHGFAAAARWLRHPDPRIDEEILGNGEQ